MKASKRHHKEYIKMEKIHKDNYKSFRTELGLKEVSPAEKKAIQKKAISGELSGDELVASSYDTHE